MLLQQQKVARLAAQNSCLNIRVTVAHILRSVSSGTCSASIMVLGAFITLPHSKYVTAVFGPGWQTRENEFKASYLAPLKYHISPIHKVPCPFLRISSTPEMGCKESRPASWNAVQQSVKPCDAMLQDLWTTRKPPTALHLTDLQLPKASSHQNGVSHQSTGPVSACKSLGYTDQHKDWTLLENTQVQCRRNEL